MADSFPTLPTHCFGPARFAAALIGGLGNGGAVARLILIDNSASMAGPSDANSSKFTLAIHAVEQLLKLSHPGDSVSVRLMIPDSSVNLPREFNPDLGALRDSLGKCTPTDGAASVGKVVRQALVSLAAERQPMHELHIFTDLQQRNWGEGELEGEPAFLQTQIVVHRLASSASSGSWVSLKPETVPTGAIPVGRLTVVDFTLKNEGKGNGTVRFNTSEDDGKGTSRDLIVAPGQAIPVSASFSFSHLGFHWARVWLDGDAAEGASQISLGFWIKETQKAYFLGDLERYGALPFAVSPGGNAELSGVEAKLLPTDQMGGALADKPLCVASTYADWILGSLSAKVLESFVRAGGTVFIVPQGTEAKGDLGSLSTALSLSVRAEVKPTDPESMLILQAGDPIWRDLRDGEGKPQLGLLRVFHYRPLRTDADWQPLITSSSGSTLLACRSMGQGRIFASGVAFLPGWSSLPLKPGFVVFIQNALFGARVENVPVQNIEAGSEVSLEAPETAFSIHSLVGPGFSWEGLPREFPGLSRAGVYEIKQGEKISWAAVHAVADEAKPDFLSRRAVPLLKHFSQQVLALNDENDVQQVLPAALGSRSTLYGWALALALVVLLLETWIANQRRGSSHQKLLAALQPMAKKPNQSVKNVP